MPTSKSYIFCIGMKFPLSQHLTVSCNWSPPVARIIYLKRCYACIKVLEKSQPFPEGTLLVAWDVVSMFPNINNDLDLGAVKIALYARDHLVPSTSRISEAVEICFTYNHSVFNEKFYLQIHGTSMGRKNACSYADLAKGKIDHKAKFCSPIKPAQ